MEPAVVGNDINVDCLTFMAKAYPVVAQLRDKFIGLASELSVVMSSAERANRDEMHLQRGGAMGGAGLGSGGGGSTKRAAISTPGMRRFKLMRKWDATKQPRTKVSRTCRLTSEISS